MFRERPEVVKATEQISSGAKAISSRPWQQGDTDASFYFPKTLPLLAESAIIAHCFGRPKTFASIFRSKNSPKPNGLALYASRNSVYPPCTSLGRIRCFWRFSLFSRMSKLRGIKAGPNCDPSAGTIEPDRVLLECRKLLNPRRHARIHMRVAI